MNVYKPEDITFALDIGTRSIIGIVGIEEKNKFRVISAEVVEHKKRAMLDGQIHDIDQVAIVVKEVKEKLEKKLGFTLKTVAIAAAGRVLKTIQLKVEKEIESSKEINQKLISSLEMEGIQIAQLKLDDEMDKHEKSQFYCVGYSVINYYLNNYITSTLIGHKGKLIGADILATFLPHVVVDSLYTVMDRADLEVISLTLEPIAAINVTIPKELRMLNLALVDVGAGTSDIAITKDGTVIAYGMVPIAGDEITEIIAQHFLVDFNASEKIKIFLSTDKKEINFINILGEKKTIGREEVLEVIKPSIDMLSNAISQKILDYNNKAPNAVFLIGGGSQIPGLIDDLSEKLKLQKDRVVIRGREIIKNIKYNGKKLTGPDAITPFGIAITAQMQKAQDFLSITVNSKKIRLFNSKKLTVVDALILVGYNPEQLIGRTGKNITLEVNGKRRVIRGEHGNPAEIYVNDSTSSLETYLNAGDEIRIVPSVDGEDAHVRVSDFIKNTNHCNLFLNNSEINIDTKVFVNGKRVSPDFSLSDGDSIQYKEIISLNDLLSAFEIDTKHYNVSVNGKTENFDYLLKDSDKISYFTKAIDESYNQYKGDNDEKPSEEGKYSSNISERKFINSIDEKKNEVYITVNGMAITLSGDKKKFIFVDIFNFIDFDISKPQGSIVLKLNGSQASFTDEIKSNDVVDIYWDKN